MSFTFSLNFCVTPCLYASHISTLQSQYKIQILLILKIMDVTLAGVQATGIWFYAEIFNSKSQIGDYLECKREYFFSKIYSTCTYSFPPHKSCVLRRKSLTVPNVICKPNIPAFSLSFSDPRVVQQIINCNQKQVEFMSGLGFLCSLSNVLV